MILSQAEKSIEFKIDRYQFPLIKSKKDFDYDANWLICKFVYKEDNLCETYEDASLLTYELADLKEAFYSIIEGDKNSFISDFLEPYLKIAIVKMEEKIIFTLHFVYDTLNHDWKTREITSVLSKEESIEIYQDLQNMCDLYPEK